jgi:hypothetical protein
MSTSERCGYTNITTLQAGGIKAHIRLECTRPKGHSGDCYDADNNMRV